MLKIFNYMDHGGHHVFGNIADGLLDYLPGDQFREVSEVQDADIVLMRGVIESNGVFRVDLNSSELGNFSVNHIETDLKARQQIIADQSVINAALLEKHRIIWIDALGPGIHKAPLNAEKTGLREDDIVISAVPLGKRSNTFTDVWHIEKSMFRPRGRFEREKGSVTVCNDNISPGFFSSSDIEIVDMIQAIIPVVSNLYVTGAPQMSEELEDALGDNLEKATCLHLTYPQGVARQLAKSEFVLTTREKLGIELMGIEGGLAGCQPIYPGTEFYREAFDGTGVVFYDTKDRAASLRSVIETGSQFDAEATEAFRQKFSAEETLPAFWQKVYDLYSG